MTHISTWSPDAVPLKPWSAACMGAIGVCPVRFWGHKWSVGDIVKYPLEGVVMKIVRPVLPGEGDLSSAIIAFRGWPCSNIKAKPGDVFMGFACVVLNEECTEEDIAEANRQLADEKNEDLTKREAEIVKQLVESVTLS